MHLERLTSARLYPMSPMELLSHVRVSTPEESRIVETYLAEAVDQIEQVCERSFCYSRFRLTISTPPYGVDTNVGPLPFSDNHRNSWPGQLLSGFQHNSRFDYVSAGAILLPIVPVVAVHSIQYYDYDGNLQTWAADQWQTLPGLPTMVYPAEDATWPRTEHRRDAIIIEFTAGETDQVTFNETGTPRFTSVSAHPYANGDQVTLRSSGAFNSALGTVAVVPDGLTENGAYFVVDSDNAGRFNLAETAQGTAIVATVPATAGQEIQQLYVGHLSGNSSAAIRKEALESYTDRGCSDGTCHCSGSDADAFFQMPHLRSLVWKSILTIDY